jgi:glutamate 5-kinase
MSGLTAQKAITDAKRLVIKIGSSLLVQPNGRLREKWLQALAADVADLRENGCEIILVSSGAIALGCSALSYDKRPERLEEAQAAASVGQIRLAQAYQAGFERHTIVTAQVLLTLDDLEDRPRYLNARNTVQELLSRGAIPVINENDTVATSEIRFGDNDRLAARVAQMAGADTLVLLSDIDGLYDGDPRSNKRAKLVPLVTHVTAEIETMAGPPAAKGVGSGGMVTKVGAAKIALAGGSSMIIMNGTDPSPIRRLLDGEACTLFTASSTPLAVRKRWIQGMMAPKGTLHIDAGAIAALKRGASLLPAGITRLEGSFKRGDLVSFKGPDGSLVGQGLVSYASADTAKLKGKSMRDAAAILGYAGRSALIHRDDLVLI